MKLTELENQFKTFIESKETNALSKEGFEGKTKIWNRIQQAVPLRTKSIPSWTLVAASLLLILLASVAIEGIQYRNHEISRLEIELETLAKSKNQLNTQFTEVKNQLYQLQNRPPVIDTVYQTKIVYRSPNHQITTDIEDVPVQEKPAVDNSQQIIFVEEGMLDLASIQNNVQSFKIEYGQKTKNETIPWTFTVKYQ